MKKETFYWSLKSSLYKSVLLVLIRKRACWVVKKKAYNGHYIYTHPCRWHNFNAKKDMEKPITEGNGVFIRLFYLCGKMFNIKSIYWGSSFVLKMKQYHWGNQRPKKSEITSLLISILYLARSCIAYRRRATVFSFFLKRN